MREVTHFKVSVDVQVVLLLLVSFRVCLDTLAGYFLDVLRDIKVGVQFS